MTTYSSTMLQALAIGGGFSPGAQAQAAARYALAISGGDPGYSSGGNVGLWAVPAAGSGYTAQQLASPAINAIAAHKLYVAAGSQFPTVTVQANPLDTAGAAAVATATGGLSLVPGELGAASHVIPGLSGVDAIASDVDRAGAWITNPSNWLHVAYVIGGGVLVLGGLFIIARPAINGTAGAVTKVATGRTPVGRAVKAVGTAQRQRAAKATAAQARTRAAAERTHRRARTQARIEERHGWARAREQRAAERHAAKKTAPKKTTPKKTAPKKTTEKESGSGD